MAGDVIGAADEALEGEPLLVPVMRGGELVRRESLAEIRERSAAQLGALPERLRRPRGEDLDDPYPVSYSERLRDSILDR
jgi:nicotinate phosphoribosyltransferase